MMKFATRYQKLSAVVLLTWMLCCVPSAVGQSASEHASILPGETVLAVSFAKGTDQSKSNWKKSGLSQLFDHPGLAKFFTTLQNNAKAKQQSKAFAKVDFRGLWKLIDGRLTFAMSQQNGKLNTLLVADVKSNAAANNWLNKLKASFNADRQIFHALKDGKIYVANSAQLLQPMMGNQTGGRSLASLPQFLSLIHI